jgi:hypothetical protein
MKKPKVERCPLCGKKPELKPYPNGKGYSVRCNTDDCAMWPYEIDLQDWNRRYKAKIPIKISKYFYDTQVVYVSGKFVPFQIFVCKECGRSHTDMTKVKHLKKCSIGRLLNASR